MNRTKNKIELITGLDIGSTAVRIAIGQQSFGEKGVELQIVGAVEVPAEGINRGSISSIEECVSSISNALEQAERLVGVPIEHAWVGISGTHIESQESRGVVAVAKSNGEIAEEDVARAVEASRTVATPLNYEILHVLPRSFTVDGQTGIKDPVGMTGIRLEVETKIIQGVTQHIKNLTKAVYRTGIDIDDLVLSILAVGDTVVTSRQKDLGVAVVNIGGSTTSMIVYEEGDIIHTAVFPIGSEHITNDLAIGLRSPIDVAERIKIEYGACIPKNISKKEMVDLSSVGGGVNETVELKYIAEIIGARMEEILERINTELMKIGRSGLLPAGIVFTGGGAKLSGLIDLSKEKNRLPASLGYPIDLVSITDKVNNLSFATAIGLVKWGANINQRGRGRQSRIKSVERVSGQVKNWFKSLVP
ncbi:MAG TPA: cell division protein FtsA [Candidatus Magasanikbacteria bacterium]|nr:cell division protein FtsA [Candidatus Magasanikbacteria bacterium]